MIEPFSFRKAVIRRIVQENESTKRFYLEADQFPEFLPGQFNMLYVYSQGEVPISISSLCKGLIEHTVRLAGDVTEDLFSLSEGSVIGLRGPYGRAFPVAECEGKDLLLVAGGLGLADIKPVVEYVMQCRERYGHVSLFIGSKSPSGLLYKDVYSLWEEYVELHLTVDRASGDWKGNVGLVTELLHSTDLREGRTVAMLCGPEPMMKATASLLMSKGLPPEDIFLSLERHMKCAVGTCGHCQLGSFLVCVDGPVFSYSQLLPFLSVREV